MRIARFAAFALATLSFPHLGCFHATGLDPQFPLPDITETEARDIGADCATLRAHVAHNGSWVRARFSVHADDGSLVTESETFAAFIEDPGLPMAFTVRNLAPGTAYTFRVVAENYGGEKTGEPVPFRTADAPAEKTPAEDAAQ